MLAQPQNGGGPLLSRRSRNDAGHLRPHGANRERRVFPIPIADIDLSAVKNPDALGHFKAGTSPAADAFVCAPQQVVRRGLQRG
jgi:hypothetical protein